MIYLVSLNPLPERVFILYNETLRRILKITGLSHERKKTQCGNIPVITTRTAIKK